MNNTLLNKVLEDPCDKNIVELKENLIRSKDTTFIDRLNESLKFAMEKLNAHNF